MEVWGAVLDDGVGAGGQCLKEEVGDDEDCICRISLNHIYAAKFVFCNNWILQNKNVAVLFTVFVWFYSSHPLLFWFILSAIAGVSVSDEMKLHQVPNRKETKLITILKQSGVFT